MQDEWWRNSKFEVSSFEVKGKASSHMESKKENPAKVPSIEAMVVEMGPEREQEVSKIVSE